MSYEPKGFSYLAKLHKATENRRSAYHLRNLTSNYTTEEKWVRDFRKTAENLDAEASKLEQELKTKKGDTQ